MAPPYWVIALCSLPLRKSIKGCVFRACCLKWTLALISPYAGTIEFPFDPPLASINYDAIWTLAFMTSSWVREEGEAQTTPMKNINPRTFELALLGGFLFRRQYIIVEITSELLTFPKITGKMRRTDKINCETQFPDSFWFICIYLLYKYDLMLIQSFGTSFCWNKTYLQQIYVII